MLILAWILMTLGAYPLWRAWQVARATSLAHALHWTVVAWSAWAAMLFAEAFYPELTGLKTVRYLAVCLTACAAIAVLGARRPGVGAWNFVVAGLLAVLLLPVLQGLGEPRLGLANSLFLGGLLVLGVLNYLPTSMGLAALLLGTGSIVELWDLGSDQSEMAAQALPVGRTLVALGPLTAAVMMAARTPPTAEFDQIWRDFRDRYGLVWSRRVQEQFNHAAVHAGWPVVLRWQGIRLKRGTSLPELAVQEEIVGTLHGLLRRFGSMSDVNV